MDRNPYQPPLEVCVRRTSARNTSQSLTGFSLWCLLPIPLSWLVVYGMWINVHFRTGGAWFGSFWFEFALVSGAAVAYGTPYGLIASLAVWCALVCYRFAIKFLN